jgi:hypothetical protein
MADNLTKMIKIGDIVYFRPKEPTIGWAAGFRKVTGVVSGGFVLRCGNIRLLARADEVESPKRQPGNKKTL